MNLLEIIVFMIIVNSATTFPAGPPNSVCSEIIHFHNTNPQPLHTLPYKVTASSSNYQPGDKIQRKLFVNLLTKN